MFSSPASTTWFLSELGCSQFIHTAVSWMQAKAQCMSKGADMFSSETTTDVAYFQGMASSPMYAGNYRKLTTVT